MSASPAPESTSTGAFMNWSAPWGSTRWGRPWSRAASIVAGPPWLMIAVQWGSSSSCGAKSATRTCAGRGPSDAGSAPGPTVTSTLTGSVLEPGERRLEDVGGAVEQRAEREVDGVGVGQRGELLGAPREPLARRDVTGPGPHRDAVGEGGDGVALQRRRAQLDERRVEDAVGQLGHAPCVAQLAEAGTEPRPRLGRQRPEAVHQPRRPDPLGRDGAGQLGDRMDHEVGPPRLGPRHEVVGAAQGGAPEHAGDERRDPHRRVDRLEVRHEGREGGTGLVTARPDVPHGEATTSGLGGTLGAGRDHDLVTGGEGGPGQRQEWEQVAVRRPRGEQDASRHPTRGPRPTVPGSWRRRGQLVEMSRRQVTARRTRAPACTRAARSPAP